MLPHSCTRVLAQVLIFCGMVFCLAGVGADSPERLAKRECSKCHAFPPPESMHLEDWEKGAFPYLEDLLGIDQIKNYDATTQSAVLTRWEAIKATISGIVGQNPNLQRLPNRS